MKKEKVIKRLLRLGIITLITSLILVSLSSYRKLINNQELKEEDQTLVKPMNIQLKDEVIPTIKARKEYTVEEVSEGLFKPTPTPTPTVALTSQPTEAVASPSPVATGSEATESGSLEETE